MADVVKRVAIRLQGEGGATVVAEAKVGEKGLVEASNRATDTAIRNADRRMAKLRAEAVEAAVQARKANEAMISAQATNPDAVRTNIDRVTGVSRGDPRRAEYAAQTLYAADDRQARAAAAIRAEIDPLAAATDRYNTELREMAALQARGHLTAQEFAQGQDLAKARLDATTASLNQHSLALERMAREGREAYAAEQHQRTFNAEYAPGLGRPVRSAAASAAVFEEDDRQARAAAAIRAEIDPLTAAQDRYTAALQRTEVLKAKGHLTDSEFIAYQNRLQAELDQTTAALGRNTRGLTRRQMAGRLNITRQLTDIGVTGAMGMNPAMIAIQQGPQLLEAMSEGGVKVSSSMLLMGGALTAAAAGVAVLTAAYLSGEKASLALERAATGLGRTSGVTAGELDQLARAGAEQAEISTASARAQAAAYVSTGRIGSEVIGGLIAIGKDYAAVMGQDAEEATQSLAKAMAEPDKAAAALTDQIGLLDLATLDHIESLVKQGDRLEAQKILLEALTGAVSGQADKIGEVSNAWDAAARAVKNYWSALHDALHTNPDERLEQLDQSLVRMYRQREQGSARSRPQWDRAIAAEEARRAEILTDKLNDAAQGRTAAANRAAFQERQRQERARGGSGGRSGSGGGSAERDAREAQQRARREEDRQVEIQMASARAAEDADRIRALEDQAALTRRLRELEDDGLSAAEAQAKAEAEQAQLMAARDVSMNRQLDALQRTQGLELDRLLGNEDIVATLERQEALQARIGAYEATNLKTDKARALAKADMLELDRARATVMAREVTLAAEAHALTLARLAGDDRRARQLEIQERIQSRAREIEKREKLKRGAGEDRARREISAEEQARMVGIGRDWAKGLAQDIRRSGIDDALADQLNRAADRMLDKLIDSLFNIDWAGILGGGKGGGGGWISAGLKFLFGGVGKNADGTDFWKGGPTWVGERGPELAWLPRGTAITDSARSMRMAAGMGSAASASQAPTFVFSPSIDARGAGPREVDQLRAEMNQLALSLPTIVPQIVNDATARRRIRA